MQLAILLTLLTQLKLQWNLLFLSVGFFVLLFLCSLHKVKWDVLCYVIKACPHKIYIQFDESTDVDDLLSY